MPETSDDVAATLGLGSRRRFRRAWIGYAAALLGMAGLGVWYWLAGADSASNVRYVTAEAERTSFSVVVTATGTVEPTNLVEISSELSGTLAKVNVDFNDRVEPGTVLATLDTAKLKAQLAVSQASLDSAIARVAMAEATLDEAREQYETALSLEERGITSRQAFVSQRAAWVRAQAELQAAIADRKLAEANLDLQQTELDKACICSPIRGVVLDRSADAGQIVASALSAPVLFTIAEDLTEMELHVDIDEADIGQVAVGNSAVFTVEAYDEREFPAEISEIRFAPETIDGVVTYKAVLSIDNSDLLLRPGMTATADITVARLEDVLTVPSAALRYAPPAEAADDGPEDERSGLLGMLMPRRPEEERAAAEKKTVWILKDGVAREIAVQTGASDGRVTEIVGGMIAEGDMVITDRING